MQAGINRIIHNITGRFGKEGVQALYDVEELSVIHNTISIALLIMREAHQGADNLSHKQYPSDIIG